MLWKPICIHVSIRTEYLTRSSLLYLQLPWPFLMTAASESQNGCCTSSHQIQTVKKEGLSILGLPLFIREGWFSSETYCSISLAQNYIPKLFLTMTENGKSSIPFSRCSMPSSLNCKNAKDKTNPKFAHLLSSTPIFPYLVGSSAEIRIVLNHEMTNNFHGQAPRLRRGSWVGSHKA